MLTLTKNYAVKTGQPPEYKSTNYDAKRKPRLKSHLKKKRVMIKAMLVHMNAIIAIFAICFLQFNCSPLLIVKGITIIKITVLKKEIKGILNITLHINEVNNEKIK